MNDRLLYYEPKQNDKARFSIEEDESIPLGIREYRKEMNNIAIIYQLIPKVGRKLVNNETPDEYINKYRQLLWT